MNNKNKTFFCFASISLLLLPLLDNSFICNVDTIINIVSISNNKVNTLDKQNLLLSLRILSSLLLKTYFLWKFNS